MLQELCHTSVVCVFIAEKFILGIELVTVEGIHYLNACSSSAVPRDGAVLKSRSQVRARYTTI